MIDTATYQESITNMDVQLFALESFIKRYERSVYINMADRGYSFIADLSRLNEKRNKLSAIRMQMYVQLNQAHHGPIH